MIRLQYKAFLRWKICLNNDEICEINSSQTEQMSATINCASVYSSSVNGAHLFKLLSATWCFCYRS